MTGKYPSVLALFAPLRQGFGALNRTVLVPASLPAWAFRSICPIQRIVGQPPGIDPGVGTLKNLSAFVHGGRVGTVGPEPNRSSRRRERRRARAIDILRPRAACARRPPFTAEKCFGRIDFGDGCATSNRAAVKASRVLQRNRGIERQLHHGGCSALIRKKQSESSTVSCGNAFNIVKAARAPAKEASFGDGMASRKQLNFAWKLFPEICGGSSGAINTPSSRTGQVDLVVAAVKRSMVGRSFSDSHNSQSPHTSEIDRFLAPCKVRPCMETWHATAFSTLQSARTDRRSFGLCPANSSCFHPLVKISSRTVLEEVVLHPSDNFGLHLSSLPTKKWSACWIQTICFGSGAGDGSTLATGP